MFTSIRKGLATNSSSTHSIVLHSDIELARQVKNAPPVSEYDINYALTEPRDKLLSLIASYSRFRNDGFDEYAEFLWYNLEDEREKLGITGEFEDFAQEARYRFPFYDFENAPELPTLADGNGGEVTAIDIAKMILSDQVVIYGFYDQGFHRHQAMADDVAMVNLLEGKWKARKDGDALVMMDVHSGDKLRWSPAPYEKASVPELVDVKITDYCGFGCAFCYQGSTKEGVHAPLERIEEIFKELSEMGTFEVALGGGEPTHHPQFHKILLLANKYDLQVNFTSYGTDWLKKKRIQSAIQEIYKSSNMRTVGVGVSVHKHRDLSKFETIRKGMNDQERPWAVKPIAQTVIGATPFETTEALMEEAMKRRIPLLLLGYKPVGRGADFQPSEQSREEIKGLIERARDHIRSKNQEGVPICKNNGGFHLSVDTAFLDLYGDVLDELGIHEALRSSPEGAFSMYIDAVEDLVAPSSYCAKSEYMPRGDLREQFASFVPTANAAPAPARKS